MIYSHASRYFTQSHILFFDAAPDLIAQYANELDLIRFKNNSTCNIFLSGPVRGETCALMLSEIFATAGYTVGCFFSMAHDLWVNDVRQMIRINGRPLSQEEFLLDASDFREAVTKIESRIDRPLPPASKRLLFAGFVFKRHRCNICILDDSQFDPADRETPFSSELFTPVFTIVTGPGPSSSPELSYSDRCMSAAIKSRTKVVVSNLQQFYQNITKTCSLYNCRKTETARAQLTIHSESLGGISFSYRGFGPFEISTLSQSVIQDAMAALDLVRAMEEFGYKTTIEHVSRGLSQIHCPNNLHLLSLTPTVFLSQIYSFGDALLLHKSLLFMVEHAIIHADICWVGTAFFSYYKAAVSSDLSLVTSVFPEEPETGTLVQKRKATASALQAILKANEGKTLVFCGNTQFLDRIEKAFHSINR